MTDIEEIFSLFINTLSSKEKLDFNGENLSQDDRESLILSFNIAFEVWKKLMHKTEENYMAKSRPKTRCLATL